MTPLYLSKPSSSFPLVELKEEQHLQLFLSPHQAAASLHGPSTSSFNPRQDQRGSLLFGEPKPHDHQVAQSHGRSSDQNPFFSSSFQPVTGTTNDIHKCSSSKRSDDNLEKEASGGDGSAKWMPSKMRLIQKMLKTSDKVPMKFTLKLQDQRYNVNESSSSNYNNNNNSTIRVCSDCNTTTTPLWRSGPRGPKSLCNACGIRQRKARRAAEAAAAAAENGTVTTNIESSLTTKTNKLHINKEKKCRSHIGQSKKLCKPPDSLTHQSPKKLCFKNIALSLSKNSAFQGVYSQDVEEAAILLMELSCGFVHSRS